MKIYEVDDTGTLVAGVFIASIDDHHGSEAMTRWVIEKAESLARFLPETGDDDDPEHVQWEADRAEQALEEDGYIVSYFGGVAIHKGTHLDTNDVQALLKACGCRKTTDPTVLVGQSIAVLDRAMPSGFYRTMLMENGSEDSIAITRSYTRRIPGGVATEETILFTGAVEVPEEVKV